MLASVHNFGSKQGIASGQGTSLVELGKAAGLSALADRYLAQARVQEEKDGPVIIVPTSFHAQGIRKNQEKIEELLGRSIVRVDIQKEETPRQSAVVQPIPVAAKPMAMGTATHQVSLPLPPNKTVEELMETERQNRLLAPRLISSPEYDMPLELVRRWAEGVNKGASGQALWIFGEPGSGKTFLAKQLHAWVSLKKRMVHIDATAFFHEWRRALDTGEIAQFNKKYRENTDVLVLECLDELRTKDKTRQEVLITATALMERGGSIVVTSTLHPMHTKEFLEPALFSRLFSGYTIEMPAPDRVFKEKLWDDLMLQHGMQDWPLDMMVQQKLFSMPVKTIGKLNSLYLNTIGRLSVRQTLQLKDLNDMEDMFIDRSQGMVVSGVLNGKSPFDLVDSVCRICGVSRSAIQGKGRRSDIALARRFVCLALSRYIGMTNAMVASIVDKDPSTVHHALKSIELDVETDRHIAQQWSHIVVQLGLDRPQSHSSRSMDNGSRFHSEAL